jgi:cell division septation protein DedD
MNFITSSLCLHFLKHGMRYLSVFVCFLCLPALAVAQQSMQGVSVSEDSILLLDVRLNNNIILASMEAYPHEQTTLVAVEPLFDALSLKYQLFSDRLIVWKDEDQFTFPLKDNATGNFTGDSNNQDPVYWFNDGYFVFMDIHTLSELFGVSFETNRFQLRLDIVTQEEKGYLFPLQRIRLLEKQRLLAAALKPRETRESYTPPITIDDQYQLFTLPNGRISAALSWNEDDRNNYYSVQLASDLLYHAADLTLTKTNNEDLAARLRMSRFKTRPDNYILGAFDSYSWGDVSGSSNNLTTSTTGGLGLTMKRNPENFRRKNLTITLQETAPPGWEAELFRNNQFITLTTVPNDGLLTFEDVLTEYGNNYFQIKLYSPFGEVQIIEKYYDLSTNALTEGAMAYNLFALDANHRLIDDQSNADREVTDYGVTFDYGIYDYWQIGIGLANTQTTTGEDIQFYSLKNAFTLPGMLLENDTAINNEGGYAQMTSLIGNAFANQRFSLSAESAENYSSARIDALDESYSSFSGSLGGSVASYFNYNFNASYFDQGPLDYWRVSNSIYTNFRKIYFSHTLNYFSTENIIPVGTDIFGQLITQQRTTNSITGQLGISGKLIPSVRASGNISYNPESSSPILDSSSFLLEWNPKPFGINNYLTARYQPLSDSDNNWQLSHRILWEHKNFQFTFSSNYNADERWTVDAGIRFFLGYDQYNNRAIMRNYTNHQSATLDVHTYLDRQANGIPDPLDYNLQDVEFIGAPDWEGITSGETGKAILPGAAANGPFYFGAKWKNGAETINKDYVIYTHPGARIKVNMPFYLTSEIFGFVERAGNNAPMNNVKVLLKGRYSERTTQTDSDGFFEFTGLQPDQYEVRIAPEFLQEKNFTGEVIGYRLTTPDSGGFVELDVISLERKDQQDDVMSEKIPPFTLTPNNSEALIREDNPRKKRNYFNLPVKDKLEAPHILPDLEQGTDAPAADTDKPLAKLDSGRDAQSSTLSNTPSLPGIRFVNKVMPEAALTAKSLTAGSLQGASKNIRELQRKPDAKTANTASITIQLGAFKQKEQADTLANTFNDQPMKAEVHQAGGFYRVIIGKFSSKDEANRYSQQYLKNKRIYIRQRNSEELN